MNKVINHISIFIFIGLLIIPSFLWLTVGDVSTESFDEKRELAVFPERIGNMFFKEVDDWYKDNLPYRNFLITKYKTNYQVSQTIFRKEVEPYLNIAFLPLWYHGSPKDYLEPIEENLAIYGKNDWLFYAGDNSVDFYKGANILSLDEMQNELDTFLKLNDICKGKGIKLAFVVPPNKEQVMSEYMPSYEIVNDYKREQVLCDYIKENSDLTYIYLLDDLLDVKDLYAPYYKQDTHWNEVGAFVGVMNIYKEIGYPYMDIEDVNIQTILKVGGDLSEMCGYATEYDDYIVEYKNDITVNGEDFENGSAQIFVSNANTNRNLVLIGDSFRLSSKNYLTKDFKKSYICHRAVITNEMVEGIKSLKDGDLLLIMPVERYDATNVEVANKLIEILESN